MKIIKRKIFNIMGIALLLYITLFFQYKLYNKYENNNLENENMLLNYENYDEKELFNIIRRPLMSNEFIELRKREELHTYLWNSIFRNVTLLNSKDEKKLVEYKKKLMSESLFLTDNNIDNLPLNKKVLSTVHQSLYPWLYGNKFNTFSDIVKSMSGKGIVICTGDKHFKLARSSIDTLRNILNCTLPIEVFYNGESDLSLENINILKEYNDVYVSDFSTYFNNEIINVSGWAIKPFAILASRFEEVILMDADVLYLRNPASLFENKHYQEKGTLFFQDRTLNPGLSLGSQWVKEWMNNPLPETRASRFWKEKTSHEMESSTVVMHKTKTILGLLNVCKFNEYRFRLDVVYKMVYGDKETFWMGFDMARQSYYMNSKPCVFIGELFPNVEKNENEMKFCGHIAHMLEDGKILFWNGHLIRDKKNINSSKTKIMNFTAYVEGPQKNWTPGLTCLKFKKNEVRKKLKLFSEETQNIFNSIIEREKQKHFVLQKKKGYSIV